jgi:hypothetical protein
MSETIATVAKVAIAAVIIVALIAVGKKVVDRMNPAVQDAVDTGDIQPIQ